MTPLEWTLICTAGLGVSALGTIVGLGGGVFMVPILVAGFGVPLKVAIPAVTVCIFPSSLLTTFFNARRRRIDYRAAIGLEIPSLIGAVTGAALIDVVAVGPLQGAFALFVAFMGVRILRKPPEGDGGVWHRINSLPPCIYHRRGELTYHTGVPALGLFGFASGLVAGLFGVGGPARHEGGDPREGDAGHERHGRDRAADRREQAAAEERAAAGGHAAAEPAQ